MELGVTGAVVGSTGTWPFECGDELTDIAGCTTCIEVGSAAAGIGERAGGAAEEEVISAGSDDVANS